MRGSLSVMDWNGLPLIVPASFADDSGSGAGYVDFSNISRRMRSACSAP
jgi:hypothetical protein